MTIAEPLAYGEDKSPELEAGIHKLARADAAFRQTETRDGELSTENLGNLLRRLSKTSMDEIDSLIGELQTLRRKLHTDGDRIQRDIAEYAELSQQVMQLTKIISESVKKLPTAPRVNR
jgi:methyl-accepting chemotaxis protein